MYKEKLRDNTITITIINITKKEKDQSWNCHCFFSTADYDPNGDMLIQAGTYNYPVRFTLPQNIPSSYESHTGHVRHCLKAIIERSTFKFDQKTESLFTVVCPYDLNNITASVLVCGKYIHFKIPKKMTQSCVVIFFMYYKPLS